MNNRSWWSALALAVFVIAAAAAIGIGAYNAGLAHGIASSAQALPAPPAGAPYVYVRPWGFGLFPFFPFLFVLFLFLVLRGFLWRGPWRSGRGCRYDGPPADRTA
jgi:hypothetical protein